MILIFIGNPDIETLATPSDLNPKETLQSGYCIELFCCAQICLILSVEETLVGKKSGLYCSLAISL